MKRNIARELIALASGQSHLGIVAEPVSNSVELDSETTIIID